MSKGKTMNLLEELTEAFNAAKECFKELMTSDECTVFRTEEIYGTNADVAGGCGSEGCINAVAEGDNLEYMHFLMNERKLKDKLQLIYLDPPFFSKGKYSASVRLDSKALGPSPVIKAGAYDDCQWEGMKEYLEMIAVRIFVMRELLSETGLMAVHLDHRAMHYVKVLLDMIFGEKNFVNEIVWTYKSGGTGRRSFARKHDTVLLYAKSGKYKFNTLTEKSYNRGFKPYRFKGVEEFEDENGWYTNVNMKDVWNIDMVGRTSSERTGYATQKPEKLIERLVTACSDEGDLCADFFAGSGTFGAVCSKLNRRWMMCDNGSIAVACQICRLANNVKKPFAVVRSTSHASGKNSGGAHIDMDISSGHVKPLRYVVNHKEINCSDKDIVSKYLSEDSLSLIKCMSIDPDFDGDVHRAARIIKSGAPLEIECTGKHRKINVVVYDVFGNRTVSE